MSEGCYSLCPSYLLPMQRRHQWQASCVPARGARVDFTYKTISVV